MIMREETRNWMDMAQRDFTGATKMAEKNTLIKELREFKEGIEIK